MTSYQTAMEKTCRQVHIRATLTLSTGYVYALTGSDILSYSLSEGVSSGSQLLGCAISAHGSITLANPNGAWQAGGEKLGNRPLLGAAVYAEIGVETASGILYEPAGSFIVSDIRCMEGEGSITLSGYDNLLHRFAAAFVDNLTYPCTVKSIFDAIVQQAGCIYTGVPACNGSVLIAQKPDWGDGCTLRTALAFAAAAMGCFVRLDRQGLLSLLPANPQTSERVLSPSRLESLSVMPGAFQFNRVRLIPRGAQSGEYTECALDAALPAGADNLIILEDNALFRPEAPELPALAQGLCTALSGLALTPFEASLPGDPTLQVGDPLLITDLSGHAHLSMLFSQQLTFDQELDALIACDANFTGISAPRMFSANGMLSSGTLPEGMIVSRHIRAGSVDAEKISARCITAEHIALGALTSESGVIGDLSASLVTSGKLDTDRLIVGGTEFSIVRALNQLANSLSQNDDRIDGDVLSDKSISAIKVTDDFGAGLELSSNAAVLLLAGKLDGTHSHMELTESAINMVGGDINIATNDLEIRGMDDGGEIMSLSPEGLSADRVIVRKEFSAPNVVMKSNSTYIDWKGSIQASLDAAPKWLTQHTVLAIPAGTYQENVTVAGFKCAKLTLSFANGVTLLGTLHVHDCDNVSVEAAVLGQGKIYPLTAAPSVVSVADVGTFNMANMQVSGYRGRTTADDGTAIGINIERSTAVILGCCVEYTGTYAILCYLAVMCVVQNCTGGCADTDPATNANLMYGVYLATGCHGSVYGTMPMAGITYLGQFSSTLLGMADTTPTAGGMEYVAPTEFTKSFNITKHCTYVYGVSRVRDDQNTRFMQGRYGTYSSGANNWRIGAMWFGDAAAELAGRTIKSARLTLRRATGGWSSAVPVYLGTVALNESAFTSTLTPAFTASAAHYPGASLNRETAGEYDVTALMSAIQSGHALGVYEPRDSYEGQWSPAYTQFYGKGSGFEPVLTVTYA